MGLGHVKRSLAIADALRSIERDVKVEWVCAEPALSFLRAKGEHLLNIAESLGSVSSVLEKYSEGGRIDMAKAVRGSAAVANRNYAKIKPFLKGYDALIQDEFVETLLSFLWDPHPPLPPKKVVITDYVKFKAPSLNPVSWATLFYANRTLRKAFLQQDLRIFADSEDALPEGRTRRWTMGFFEVVGPIVEASPNQTKTELKDALFGPSCGRVIVFSIGGTSIGRSLLHFVADHAEVLSNRLNATIALMVGPRVDPSELAGPRSRFVVLPFTYDSLRYFKAADCLVTQAGASTLHEAASLGLPCVCIPVEEHWEQIRNAQRFSHRFHFSPLRYREISVETLVSAIERATATSYTPIGTQDSAHRTARLITETIR